MKIVADVVTNALSTYFFGRLFRSNVGFEMGAEMNFSKRNLIFLNHIIDIFKL